jgi:hypothetical protein
VASAFSFHGSSSLFLSFGHTKDFSQIPKKLESRFYDGVLTGSPAYCLFAGYP